VIEGRITDAIDGRGVHWRRGMRHAGEHAHKSTATDHKSSHDDPRKLLLFCSSHNIRIF
jgi:hypothetical protein